MELIDKTEREGKAVARYRLDDMPVKYCESVLRSAGLKCKTMGLHFWVGSDMPKTSWLDLTKYSRRTNCYKLNQKLETAAEEYDLSRWKCEITATVKETGRSYMISVDSSAGEMQIVSADGRSDEEDDDLTAVFG